jgi:hypothetical protein
MILEKTNIKIKFDTRLNVFIDDDPYEAIKAFSKYPQILAEVSRSEDDIIWLTVLVEDDINRCEIQGLIMYLTGILMKELVFTYEMRAL